jgi:hypothetical protein
MAFIHYSDTGDTTHFFYHQLVSPLKQHAVYFSLLVFIALFIFAGEFENKRMVVEQAISFHHRYFPFFIIDTAFFETGHYFFWSLSSFLYTDLPKTI